MTETNRSMIEKTHSNQRTIQVMLTLVLVLHFTTIGLVLYVGHNHSHQSAIQETER